jgi:chromosome segregation ATPase
MNKKRLSDLLRAEVQKSPDLETEAGQEIPSDQHLESDTALPELEISPEITEEPSAMNISEDLRNKRTGTTKAELEATVAELKEALYKAQSRENSLQKQIIDLQSSLQTQNKLVQDAQKELEQVNVLKAEFEQAKELILKLSETNSKKPSEAITSSRPGDDSLRSQKLSLKKLPYHVIHLPAEISKLSDNDIGWVD